MTRTTVTSTVARNSLQATAFTTFLGSKPGSRRTPSTSGSVAYVTRMRQMKIRVRVRPRRLRARLPMSRVGRLFHPSVSSKGKYSSRTRTHAHDTKRTGLGS